MHNLHAALPTPSQLMVPTSHLESQVVQNTRNRRLDVLRMRPHLVQTEYLLVTVLDKDNRQKEGIVTFFFVSTYVLSRDPFIFRMSRTLRLIHIMTHSFA